jgi:hypothetical protein
MKEVLFMPISIRYNFETNSSSMHSLSVRRESGAYSADELKRSEARIDAICQDAIVTLDDDGVDTIEEARKSMHIYNNRCHIWDHYLRFYHAPMQVIASFRDKLCYAIANAYEAADEDVSNARVDMLNTVIDKYFPDVDFDLDIERGVGTNDEILFDYLEKKSISVEEFLTNHKYVVIVDYAEYCKMKWLNMVDESKIINLYHPVENEEMQMKIKDGVWSPSNGDLCFGRSPFRVLGTVEGKARYVIANRGADSVDEVLKIMQEVYPDLRRIEIPRSRYNPYQLDYGWCDDYGCTIPTDIPLRDFILDKRYVIIADGDEYCVWDDFKNTKLFNKAEYPDEKIKIDEYRY